MNETIDFLELVPGERELGKVRGSCLGMPGRSGKKIPGEFTITDQRILFEGRTGNIAAWRPAFSLPYGEIVDAEACMSPKAMRLFVKNGGSYHIAPSKGRKELLAMLDKRIPASRPARKAQPGELARLVVCAVIAIGLLAVSLGDTLASFGTPKTFDDILDATVQVGDRVCGDIYYALDYFATEQTWTENSNGSRTPKKTSAYYYIVPSGDGFAAVEVNASKGKDMEKLADETWEYLMGGPDTVTTVPFDGRAKLLEKEEPDLVEYYEELLEEYGYTQDEIDDLGPALILIPRAFNTIRAFCAVGAAFLVIAVFLAAKTFRPARTKKGGASEAPWEG
ncbi:MAG: hypothetical protein K2N78_00445 [Oscillospiraceae bacterium]|nr:hypothetical protein [Oscillospiraceae bacterium]